MEHKKYGSTLNGVGVCTCGAVWPCLQAKK